MRPFQNYLAANPRSIFLVDGLGALLSTMLLIIVAGLETFFGMPAKILYQLVPLTTMFAAYSLAAYFLRPVKWQLFLLPIAVANILYSCLTLFLVFYCFTELTKLGIAYFLGEILVIVFLAIIELRLIYAKSGHS